MPTYRKNPENTTQGKNMGSNIVIGQDQIEGATYEHGIQVETGDAKTRVISKGLQSAPLRVAQNTTIRQNAGVVMPPSDKTGIDPYPGKTGGTKIE